MADQGKSAAAKAGATALNIIAVTLARSRLSVIDFAHARVTLRDFLSTC